MTRLAAPKNPGSLSCAARLEVATEVLRTDSRPPDGSLVNRGSSKSNHACKSSDEPCLSVSLDSHQTVLPEVRAPLPAQWLNKLIFDSGGGVHATGCVQAVGGARFEKMKQDPGKPGSHNDASRLKGSLSDWIATEAGCTFEVKLRWRRHERQCASLVDSGAVPEPRLSSAVTLAMAAKTGLWTDLW